MLVTAAIALLTFKAFAVLDHLRRLAVGQQTGSSTVINSQDRRHRANAYSNIFAIRITLDSLIAKNVGKFIAADRLNIYIFCES